MPVDDRETWTASNGELGRLQGGQHLNVVGRRGVWPSGAPSALLTAASSSSFPNGQSHQASVAYRFHQSLFKLEPCGMLKQGW